MVWSVYERHYDVVCVLFELSSMIWQIFIILFELPILLFYYLHSEHVIYKPDRQLNITNDRFFNV